VERRPPHEGDPSPTNLAVKGEKELQRYMTDKIQESTARRASAQRQAHRSIVRDDAGVRSRRSRHGVPRRRAVDRFASTKRNERILTPAAGRRAAPALDHEGVALDGLVRLGGLVPGDDRVLTEASIAGASTSSRLKENVIVGRLIRRDGMDYYRNIVLEARSFRLPRGRGDLLRRQAPSSRQTWTTKSEPFHRPRSRPVSFP